MRERGEPPSGISALTHEAYILVQRTGKLPIAHTPVPLGVPGKIRRFLAFCAGHVIRIIGVDNTLVGVPRIS
jgi:hypothetical protein